MLFNSSSLQRSRLSIVIFVSVIHPQGLPVVCIRSVRHRATSMSSRVSLRIFKAFSRQAFGVRCQTGISDLLSLIRHVEPFTGFGCTLPSTTAASAICRQGMRICLGAVESLVPRLSPLGSHRDGARCTIGLESSTAGASFLSQD
jgi:hypothetical protein